MRIVCKVFCVSWLVAVPLFGQGMPTSQPEVLQVIREEIKVGHTRDHVKVESGWPAAFAKANFPYNYIALESMTGSPEVWFLAPFSSHAVMGESMKRENDDPALSEELARLSRADAEHLSGARSFHAVARKEMSHGPFPDIAKQRFYEVTIFQVRPGHEQDFENAAKAYGAALGRVSPAASFRVYEVVAGLPGGSYVVFSSVSSFGDFDKMMSEGQAVMKGLTPLEGAALQRFSSDGLISVETQRYRLDPDMSYVPQEVRDSDPAFWKAKK